MDEYIDCKNRCIHKISTGYIPSASVVNMYDIDVNTINDIRRKNNYHELPNDFFTNDLSEHLNTSSNYKYLLPILILDASNHIDIKTNEKLNKITLEKYICLWIDMFHNWHNEPYNIVEYLKNRNDIIDSFTHIDIYINHIKNNFELNDAISYIKALIKITQIWPEIPIYLDNSIMIKLNDSLKDSINDYIKLLNDY